MSPATWLRVEGAAVLAAALAGYFALGGGWPFLLLFLAPDLSMLGYLGGSRIGAASYNAFHSYAPPLALLGVARLAAGDLLLLHGALVWIAHIGLDRMLGYGLKHETGFRDTHLGRIGRDR